MVALIFAARSFWPTNILAKKCNDNIYMGSSALVLTCHLLYEWKEMASLWKGKVPNSVRPMTNWDV